MSSKRLDSLACRVTPLSTCAGHELHFGVPTGSSSIKFFARVMPVRQLIRLGPELHMVSNLNSQSAACRLIVQVCPRAFERHHACRENYDARSLRV